MTRIFLVLGILISTQNLWAQTPSPTLRLGLIQSLTGLAAEYGKAVVQAAELAAADINANSEYKIQLLVEDDATNPTQSVSAFRSLNSRGVDAVIGATWDFTTLPLLPLATKARLPLVCSSTYPEAFDLKGAGGFGFSTGMSVQAETETLRRWNAERHFNSAVIVYANNSWGEVQRDAYRKLAQELKINILAEIKPASYDANEWRTLLPRIKQHKPDLVMLLINHSDIDIFLRRSQELNFQPAFFGSSNAYNAFRLYNSGQIYEGLCFTYPLARLRRQAQFVRRYESKFEEPIKFAADSSFDTVKLIHAAFIQAKQNGQALNQTLQQIAYSGLVGTYKYSSEKSFALGDSSLVCIKHGELTLP